MIEISTQPLKYKELPGLLSARQLAEHHDVLYAGYVKKLGEIRGALKRADMAKANATWSDLRELKIEEGFAANGVVLHERYFDNLKPGGAAPAGVIATWLGEDFGSFEQWAAAAAACGLASRGWVVLAFDLNDGRLHNYVADAHHQGGVWGAIPLLVIDVYEHAYFLDYATGRKQYLDALFGNLDWSAPNALIAKYDLKRFRN